MRYLLLSIVWVITLHAVTLNEVIETARKKHPSLEAIKARIAAADYAIARAKYFDNPTLSLSINDIRFDAITNRSLEPMQTETIALSQKIPWFGKREAKEAIEKRKQKLLFATLEEAEVALIARIKEYAYTLWEIEHLIKLTEETIRVTEQSIDLFEAYTASSESGNTHMGIMSAELVRSRLRISLTRLHAKQRETMALLEYLSFQPIQTLTLNLPPVTLPSLKSLEQKLLHSPLLKRQHAKESIAIKRLELAEYNRVTDPTIRIGYSHRQAFEDFLSIEVHVALPIYGTEKRQIEEARAKRLKEHYHVQDTQERLKANLKRLYADAQREHNILHIIEQESLPQIEHMFDLIRSDIAAGGDLYKQIDLIEQKLALEAEAISARANFHKIVTQIDALIGAY